MVVDHPTGDLDAAVCTEVGTTEVSLRRTNDRYRDNLKDAEARLRDAKATDEQFEDLDKEAAAYYEVADRCEAIIDILKRRDPALKAAPTSPTRSHSARGASTSAPDPLRDLVKLPPQELAKFSGVYSDWPSFWDQYNSTVHSRTSLSKVLKFSYLRQSLTGEPYDLIKMVQVTDANYDTAVKLLQNRYSDQGMVLCETMDALYRAPSMRKDDITSLRRLLVTFTEKALGLRNVGVKDGWLFLAHTLRQKLDADTRRAYDLYQNDKKRWKIITATTPPPDPTVAPTTAELDREYDDLMAFLTERVQVWERSTTKATSSGHTTADNGSRRSDQRRNGSLSVRANVAQADSSKNSAFKCVICGVREFHYVSRCPVFLKKSPSDRRALLREKNCCYNCLAPGHRLGECKSKGTCRECHERHHTSIHIPKGKSTAAPVLAKPDPEPTTTEETTGEPPAEGQATPTVLAARGSVVFLFTVQMPCLDAYGGVANLRAMLDTGSQVDIITSTAAERLGLTLKPSNISIKGVGLGRSQRTVGAVDLTVLLPGDKQHTIQCDVLDQVVGELLTTRLPANFMDRFKGYELADPNFHTAKHIDVLIGMVHYPHLVLHERAQVDNLWLMHTVFGWAVTGRPSKYQAKKREPVVLSAAPTTFDGPGLYRDRDYLVAALNDNAVEDFARFWEVEEPPESSQPNYTVEQTLTVQHYEETTTYDPDGRPVVRLPFKEGATPLGHSKAQAVRRFLSMERRFIQDPIFHQKYKEFIKEFLDMGHLEVVPPDLPEPPDHKCFYLPHHGVLKDSSTTTKLRVVFDGSAKTSTGQSLNEALMTGPRTQQEIFKIMVRFRFHAVGLAADVAKMYRQIGLAPEDRDYQRLIWRDDPNGSLSVLRLTRVIYGIRSSAFHAVYALQKAADDIEYWFSLKRAIRDDFYVDDFLGGASSVKEAKALQSQIVKTLAKIQMPIRKWSSNSQELLDSIPPEDREEATVEVARNECGIKTLGVGWNTKRDVFSFVVPRALKDHPVLTDLPAGLKITRRKLLAAIATVFDPLGWLAPLTVRMKILFNNRGEKRPDGTMSSVLEQWNSSDSGSST